ncbi:MAG: hypothetical protein ACC628_02580 [Pirellulaceae bacterium]
MEAKQFTRPRVAFIVAALMLLAMALNSGCVGLMSAIGYWSGGAMKEAEFDGLEGKRVAVICISDSSSFGPGTDTLLLAHSVGALLTQNLKKIDVVRPDEIADWVDQNDWDGLDYEEVGRGVEADMVVAIELSGFGLYEGQTLYKGRASLGIRVLDLTEGGKEVFRRTLHELSFPANGAYPATETSESKFRRAFIQMLAQQAAKFFYDYEAIYDYGGDPASLD